MPGTTHDTEVSAQQGGSHERRSSAESGVQTEREQMTEAPLSAAQLSQRTLPPREERKDPGRGIIRHTITAPLLILMVYVLLLLTRGVDYTAAGGAAETYLSIVAVQLLVFMLPAVFYIRFRGTDVREELRLRLPGPDKIMFIVLCSLILIITSMLIGAARGNFESSVYSTDRLFSSVSAGGEVSARMYYAICFAVVPAVVEEMLFRGIIMSEYQRTSVSAAVIINTLFFSMLHFDLLNLPFYLIAGLVLSMCAYAANSIIASAIAHLCYNLFSIFGGELVTRVVGSIGDMRMITIVLCALLLLLLALTFGECERIYSSYARRNKESRYVVKSRRGEGAVRFLAALLSPMSLVCIVTYIIVIIVQ